MDFLDSSYRTWLDGIKKKIKKTQLKVAISANAQLMEMYWDLGKEIILKQKSTAWGDSILDRLALDLKLSFPNINGFSRRNLYAIRQWYLFYSVQSEFVPQSVAQIPWGITV